MKKKFLRRMLSALTCAAMLVTATGSVTAADETETEKEPIVLGPSKTDAEINFAKALQLSMYFYDANKCGPGITGGNLDWRGDCHVEDAAVPLIPMGEDYKGTNLSEEFIDEHRDILDPDGDGTIDVAGGMHDAGDHVKFCLPGSYAASTVGWGYYEFRDAYIDAGLQWHIEDILHWMNDYYLKCLYFDENGDVLAFCYQVGEGNIDHNYWIAPELQGEQLLDFARPAYFATVDTPASDMCAGVAASLAVNYLNFKDTEPEYAEESLNAAIKLYEFAVKTHSETEGNKVTSLGYDGGFYTSNYDYDELAWAAVWLYECTENWDYIEDIIAVDETVTGDMGAHPYTGYFKRIISDTGNCWQNIWVHCWDTVWGGVFAKLAPITNTSRDWYIFRWNLEYWSGMKAEDAENQVFEVPVTEHKYFGPDDTLWNTTITAEEIADLPTTDGAWLAKTPAGFSMLNEYGSARYDTAAQLCALVYAKETGDMTFADWSKGQMEYIMGNNPMGRAYIVGYDLENGACHPHHRASHGSKALSALDPVDQVHVLWGALVGGPDSDDYHVDDTNDYIYNEVAVDYNAGFVGACAGLYTYYGKEAGHEIDPALPIPEEEMKGEIREYYLEARVVQENSARSQVEVKVYNDTFLPPHYVDDIKCRYFFNVSELAAANQTIDDIVVDIFYDEENANTNGESFATISEPIKWDDNGTYYVEISWEGCVFYGKRVFHFGLIAEMDEKFKTNWDPTDDYSREGLELSENTLLLTERIPVYVDGELVWGEEPKRDGVPEPDTDNKDVLYGDADVSGAVDILDVIILNRALLGSEKLSEQGILNADVDKDGKPTAADSLAILKYIVKILDELPV
ncbi:MAG: glycoside hydrolase family 9 protein [Oscillospiraceae bacterium]|nr:glycoside hydrolase family 9 protein [Oscillospiraceae bacterium]